MTPFFNKVEIESAFKGGLSSWQLFLIKTLVYPPEAVQQHAEGEVVMEFIVDERGRVHNPHAISGNSLLRNAAVDVIRRSPAWIPAEQDGRKVKSYKRQPIIFRLQ